MVQRRRQSSKVRNCTIEFELGPLIFFDQAGPAELVTGQGVDVRPHPHVGLATVTYLYRGEVQHRDSVGSDQIIRPGDVNWMVAGRGITHSEPTPAETRKAPHSAFGIQTWVGPPEAQEDTAPSFEHHAKATLPVIESEGVSLRLILGRAYGEAAPARVFSETFYADVELKPSARIPLPHDHEDRGLYILEGSISVAGPDLRGRSNDGVPAEGPHRRRGRADGRTTSSSLAARRSADRTTSGGILSLRARRRSTPPRRSGAKAIGATVFSTFRPAIATNSFRCRLSPTCATWGPIWRFCAR